MFRNQNPEEDDSEVDRFRSTWPLSSSLSLIGLAFSAVRLSLDALSGFILVICLCESPHRNCACF